MYSNLIQSQAEIKSFLNCHASDSEKRVIGLLISMCLKNRTVIPRQQWIADQIGITRRTVSTAVKKFSHIFFDKRRRFRKGREVASLYNLKSYIRNESILRMLAAIIPTLKRLPLLFLLSQSLQGFKPNEKVFNKNISHHIIQGFIYKSPINHQEDNLVSRFLRSSTREEPLLQKRSTLDNIILDTVRFTTSQREEVEAMPQESIQHATRMLAEARKQNKHMTNEAGWFLAVARNHGDKTKGMGYNKQKEQPTKGGGAPQQKPFESRVHSWSLRSLEEINKYILSAQKMVFACMNNPYSNPKELHAHQERLQVLKQAQAKRMLSHPAEMESPPVAPAPPKPMSPAMVDMARYMGTLLSDQGKEELLQRRAALDPDPNLYNEITTWVLNDYLKRRNQ